MEEYIKREDALDAVLFALVGTGYQSNAIYAIRNIPTANAAPIADTVRKMQERLSEQFHDRVAYTRSYVHDTIDQIAKEMLEENENETTHSN
jgi:hypothetical protein